MIGRIYLSSISIANSAQDRQMKLRPLPVPAPSMIGPVWLRDFRQNEQDSSVAIPVPVVVSPTVNSRY